MICTAHNLLKLFTLANAAWAGYFATNARRRAYLDGLLVQDIRTGDDLAAAFDAGIREHVEGLLTTAESIFAVQRTRVSELAARHKLPAIYPFSIQVTDGDGLMAYGINIPDLHRRAAFYVDRILKGAKPADLPVLQPTKFELAINRKTAKALGLEVPAKLLFTADEVIE
jgi:putative ABC transport system substrate-binding protein